MTDDVATVASRQPRAAYRVCDTLDPEERLEDAALFKALYDAFDGEIVALADDAKPNGLPLYGRGRRGEAVADLPYWRDPAFLSAAGREFWVGQVNGAALAVARLHARGLGAFVKSTLPKHMVLPVPVGADFHEELDAMVYSFIDGGPDLMVQELVEMRYEWRFFVIGREIICDSPNAAHLTPIDWPAAGAYPTPAHRQPFGLPQASLIRDGLLEVARAVAEGMATQDAVIDCAEINGKPGCVELNPLLPGQVGLFACDVRSLARSIRYVHPRLARCRDHILKEQKG